MKSKIFKKLIAGIATLAMVAQFGFVLPASAEGEYLTQNFAALTSIDASLASNEWYAQFNSDGATLQTDSNDAIGKYLQMKSLGSGPRGLRYTIPAAGQTVDENKQSVLEFDFYMTKNGSYGNHQIVILDDKAGNPAYNSNYSGTSILSLTQEKAQDNFKINADAESSGYTSGWAHAKALMDFSAHTVVLTITSLDGTATYFPKTKINMSSTSGTKPGYIFMVASRGSTEGIDNIVFRPVTEDDIDVFYTVSYTGMTTTSEESVLKGSTPVNVPENPVKQGEYTFTGKWKIEGSDTEYTADEIKAMAITGDTTFVAQYEDAPGLIEKLSSISIKKHPEIKPEIPKKNADGTDKSLTYDVELSLTGEWGNDLTSADYQFKKGETIVTWDIAGLNVLNGEPTGEPLTNSDGGLVYGDSYVVLDGFTDNATKGTIKITSGVGNYYAIFKVKVKYGDEANGYIEKEDSFPMVIMADEAQVENRIYPLGGYPVNMNWYADEIVGYKSTDFVNNKQNPDPFLSGWCTWGGRDTRAIYLQQEDNGGDKYLYVTGGTATNSSVYGAIDIGSVKDQAYIDFDVKFSGAGESIQLKDLTGKKSDYDGTLNNSSFSAVHTTPYSQSLSFNGSALSFGSAGEVAGLAAGTWYRVRLSFDDSAQTLWYQVNNINADGTTGEIVGAKTDVMPYNTSATKLPQTLNYFVVAPTTTGGIGIKNLTIYKPTMAAFTVSADTDTVTIPQADTTPVTVTNIDETQNVVKVDATSKAIVTVENKTAASETAVAYFAGYNSDGGLVSVKSAKATVGANASKKFSVDVPTGADLANTILYVWDGNMQPMIEPVEDIEFSEAIEPTTIGISTLMKDADGNTLSGVVDWSVQGSPSGVKIESDPEDASKAILTVSEEADSGDIVVVASNRGQNATATIRLTGSADNIAFVDPVSSVTIPFDATPAEATYSAEVRTGAGDVISDKTVTYAMYNSTNSEPLANTSAISFDATTAKLTVTSEAKGTVVYIRATSTNTEGETISKSIPVTIHGLAFDFGAAAVGEELPVGLKEGYTLVSPTTVYTEDLGYGIESGTGVTVGGDPSSDALNGDYLQSDGSIVFKAKVPRGKNYKVNITYKGGMKVEKITDNLPGVEHPTNAALTASEINVAVIDDVLDMTISDGAQVASAEIQMLADKTPGDKPTWFTYGDSTTNSSTDGKFSWANAVSKYQLSSVLNMNNTARSGSNPEKYYNGGDINKILLNIAKGDLVTFNGMGTNGGMGNFETVITALTQACRDRGAYVIMTYYTPDLLQDSKGFTRARIYSDSEHKFIGSLRDDPTYTKIANEKGYPIIPFGQLGIDAMNDELDKVSTTDTAARDARAEEILACHLDHNHYSEPLAKIFAEKYVPYVEAAYQQLVEADAATE